MTANAFPIRIDSLFYREASLAYHTGAHEHRVHQWIYCMHGGMTVSINGSFFELHPEESIVIPPKFLSAEPLTSNTIAVTHQGAVDLASLSVKLNGRV